MSRLFLFLIFLLPFYSIPCDRSSISLTSVTPGPGGTFIINYQICFGQGTIGATNGADNPTTSYAIGIYTPGGVPVVVSAFSPPAIVGSFTGVVNSGMLVGPQGPPFSTQETVFYTDFSSTPSGLGCISSTALCGTPNTQCDNYSVTVDVMPDSMRVFGIEGSGNPVAGCTSDADMLIDFTTALNVNWGDVKVIDMDKRNLKIQWSTVTETNNDKFIVQKLEDIQHSWWDLTTIEGAGNSSTPNDYSYIDQYVSNGINYYRIKQIDFDGNYSLSKTVAIIKNYEGYVAMKQFPNPADEFITLQGMKGLEVQIYTPKGQLISTHTIDSNLHVISTKELIPGIYLLHYTSKEDTETLRFSVVH